MPSTPLHLIHHSDHWRTRTFRGVLDKIKDYKTQLQSSKPHKPPTKTKYNLFMYPVQATLLLPFEWNNFNLNRLRGRASQQPVLPSHVCMLYQQLTWLVTPATHGGADGLYTIQHKLTSLFKNNKIAATLWYLQISGAAKIPRMLNNYAWGATVVMISRRFRPPGPT